MVSQFVNFVFFKLNPAFRALPTSEKNAATEQFLSDAAAIPNLILLPYSLVGTRPDVDFCFWRISPNLDDIQTHQARINKSPLSAWLTTPYSYLSMTKRSVYVDKIDPSHTESRAIIVPGNRKYIFIYPFVKNRAWYRLSIEERQEIMDEHIKIGNEFPSVKLNTTYSFGLDDQEFVVAFETDVPMDFLNLVMKLRESAGSPYTLRDTPIFTAKKQPLPEILNTLY